MLSPSVKQIDIHPVGVSHNDKAGTHQKTSDPAYTIYGYLVLELGCDTLRDRLYSLHHSCSPAVVFQLYVSLGLSDPFGSRATIPFPYASHVQRAAVCFFIERLKNIFLVFSDISMHFLQLKVNKSGI